MSKPQTVSVQVDELRRLLYIAETCMEQVSDEHSDRRVEEELQKMIASSRSEADGEARRMATLLHDELHTGGNGSETPYSIAMRAVSAYRNLGRDLLREVSDELRLHGHPIASARVERRLAAIDAAMSAQSDKRAKQMSKLDAYLSVGFCKSYGDADFAVRASVADLTPGQMHELRAILSVAIGAMEKMWADETLRRISPAQQAKASLSGDKGTG